MGSLTSTSPYITRILMQRNSFRTRTKGSRSPSKATTSVMQSPEASYPSKSRKNRQRFPSFSFQVMPITDSSEDEGIVISSSPSKVDPAKSEAYIAPCERRISITKPFYLINETIPLLETAMSRIEFGVRSSDFTPLAFKTVINPADAEREISFLKRVEGLSNVVQLLDTFEDDEKQSVLVLPVLRQLNLLKLDLIEASRYIGQLIKALHGIHERKIIHMDITLYNLMADDENNLVLIDFGLSTLFDSYSNCSSCGTPGYIAPEVYGPDFKPTPKVDIFGAGVVLGCMLQPYIAGCDLQYLGGRMVRTSTIEGIIAKLKSFIACRNNGLLQPCGSVYGQNAGVDVPLVVYQAAELLSLMLHTNPEERPASGIILSHPFLQASLRSDSHHLFNGTDYAEFEERRHMMEIYGRQRLSSESLSYYDD